MVQIGGICQLMPFYDGISLLAHLDQSPVLPDLILIDYHLPRMNGLELTEALRTKNALKSLPVAWMSSELDPSWEGHCRDLSVTWCWVKPTNYEAWQTFLYQLCSVLGVSGHNPIWYRGLDR